MKKQLKKSLAVLLAAALFATTANLVAFSDGAVKAYASEAPSGDVTGGDVTGQPTGGSTGTGGSTTPSVPSVPSRPTTPSRTGNDPVPEASVPSVPSAPVVDDTPSYSPATSFIPADEIPTFTETSLGAMPARIDVVASAAAAEGIAALEAAFGGEVNAASYSVGRESIALDLPANGSFSAVDISFAIRGEQIHELGFELPLTLAVPVALENKELAVIHILSTGGVEQLPVTRDAEGNATFVTTSLSVFILMSKEDADKIAAAAPVVGGNTYVVKKGDCLSKIAVKFSTTIAKIMKLNTNIKDANKIYTGQKIKVK